MLQFEIAKHWNACFTWKPSMDPMKRIIKLSKTKVFFKNISDRSINISCTFISQSRRGFFRRNWPWVLPGRCAAWSWRNSAHLRRSMRILLCLRHLITITSWRRLITTATIVQSRIFIKSLESVHKTWGDRHWGRPWRLWWATATRLSLVMSSPSIYTGWG